MSLRRLQNTVYSYFVDELIDQVKADLVEKAGYTDSRVQCAVQQRTEDLQYTKSQYTKSAG